MMLIVEMVRGETGQPGFTTFDLQVKTWRKLLEVAEKFGWTPEGTVVDEDSAKRNPDYIGHFQPTYKVEPWGYGKRVTDADAVAMSKALFAAYEAIKAGKVGVLEKSGAILISEDMNEADFERLNLSAEGSLLSFAEFTANGGFIFAWDD
jgi:hypothetical protein